MPLSWTETKNNTLRVVLSSKLARLKQQYRTRVVQLTACTSSLREALQIYKEKTGTDFSLDDDEPYVLHLNSAYEGGEEEQDLDVILYKREMNRGPRSWMGFGDAESYAVNPALYGQ